jgi:hypothetical protein
MKIRSTPACFVFALLACAAPLQANDKPASDVVPPSALKKHDRNKDGVLDEGERAKWEAEKAAEREKYRRERAEMLGKFDLNKDGRLSEDERVAAKIAMERERTERDTERMRERVAKEAMEAKEAAEKEAANAKAKEKDGSGGEMMGGGSMMME